METYNINGVSVKKYRPSKAQGKAPIIMVHGGNHAAWCWDLWASYFANNGYEVHALDWYNHGDSDHLSEEEFLKRSIVDVAQKEISYVVGRLDKAPILVGHSMGGLAATAYATMGDVEKLVLVAPVMTADAKAPELPIPVDPTRPVAVFPYEQAKGLFFTTMSDDDAKKYYAMLEPESPQAVLETTHWSVQLDLGRIKAPVMVIDGEMDQIIPREPLQRYAKLLGTELQIIPGIGHCDLLLKKPEWESIAATVGKWLGD